MVFFLLSLISFTSFALTIEDSRGRLELIQNPTWEYEKNLMGLPHVFLTKDTPERSSLSVTLTGIKDVQLPSFELDKNQSQYQKGRKDWASKREAQILKFHPYQSQKIKGHLVHTIGVEYTMNKQHYIEKTYYLECPNTLVHFKFLSPNNHERLKEAEAMVMSSSCL